MPFVTASSVASVEKRRLLTDAFRSEVSMSRVPQWSAMAGLRLRQVLEEGTSFDLVADWISPLILECVAEMLSIPNLSKRLALAEASVAAIEGGSDIGGSVALVGELCELHEGVGADSVLSRLVADCGSAEDVARMVGFILAAALGPTRRAAGALLAHRAGDDASDQVADERAAVKEALRWYTPAGILYRSAIQACQVHGTSLVGGELVAVHLGLANWDPSRFREPHRYSPANRASHLSFGFGAHSCPGRHLAEAILLSVLRSASRVEPSISSTANLTPSLRNVHAQVPVLMVAGRAGK
jgi:cytochrome P450